MSADCSYVVHAPTSLHGSAGFLCTHHVRHRLVRAHGGGQAGKDKVFKHLCVLMGMLGVNMRAHLQRCLLPRQAGGILDGRGATATAVREALLRHAERA